MTDKRTKFIELAERRTNAALKAMRQLSKLASKRYEYSAEDADQILVALFEEAEKVRAAFNPPVPEQPFKLESESEGPTNGTTQQNPSRKVPRGMALDAT